MFTDFGIFPSEASSCGSRTSNNCISPSTTISLRHSRPIWLRSVSFLQDQIRSLGLAFEESALAITTRGRTLRENTDFDNLTTAREAILNSKCFDLLLQASSVGNCKIYAALGVLIVFIFILVTFIYVSNYVIMRNAESRSHVRKKCVKYPRF